MQCERGQHITVRKLDLLTWGVLLARVLVKTDVSREESMISSYVFSGNSHAALSATERRSYHVIKILGQKASWVICYQYPLVSVTVVSKFWPITKCCPVWVFFQVYIAFTFYVGKVLGVPSKHVTLKFSFQPNVTVLFSIKFSRRIVCSHVRSNLNIEHSAQLRSILDLQFIGHWRTIDLENQRKQNCNWTCRTLHIIPRGKKYAN